MGNKYIYIAIFMFNCILFAKGQTPKTYDGKFEEGTAIYQYYNNDKFDRIFHGSFVYQGSLFNMKGNFNNDIKNGKWDIFAIDKLFNGARGSIKLNTKIYGTYHNGELIGDWYYSNSIRFLNDKEEDKEISKAKFFNNHFIGTITYQSTWPRKFNIKGQFDSLGFQTGTWTYIKGTVKDEIKFINGVAYWRLIQDTTNGFKIKYCDSSNFVLKFWNSYDSSFGMAEVNGEVFYPDTIKISSEHRVPNSNSGGVINTYDDWGYSYDYSEYKFDNPICIWSNTTISVYESGYISNPLYYYDKGNLFPYGLQIEIKRCEQYSENCNQKYIEFKNHLKEKQRLEKQKERELQEMEEMKIILEQRRIDSIEHKNQFDLAVNEADSLFQLKKYKTALEKYLFANSIDLNHNTIDQINITKTEISRIDSLQKLRYEIYSSLMLKNDKIISEMTSLKLALEDKKKKYGVNYELCMNFLASKFPSYFSSINAMLSTNKISEIKIGDTWNGIDQSILDLLIRFEIDFKPYAKFHNAVKTAFETDNKEQLKSLKYSDNLEEIITKFD